MKADEDNLDALVAEYYRALAGAGKDADGHWSIADRWAYGEELGWFVDHDGHSYGGLTAQRGEDGPYATLEEARSAMAAHLRIAIAEARAR
jgi:hypothetical protein